MSVAAPSPRRWKRPPMIQRAWLRWSLALGAAIYLALALGTTEVNWTRVWEGLPRGVKFFSAFFPPDFVSRWSEIAEGIEESLWMTVVSTVIGIALSIPVGIGAAKNIAPAPVYYFCRGILAVSRSFQEIILAIFFVKLFGFGPFAGCVTLAFATIGFYGKLLAEDIEDMDPAQAEAIRAEAFATRGAAEARVLQQRIDADNAHSPELVRMKLELARMDMLPALAEKFAKPLFNRQFPHLAAQDAASRAAAVDSLDQLQNLSRR